MAITCNLTRNYSIASLLGILLVATVLVLFYRSMAVEALMEREGQANSDIARTLANSLWPKYGRYISSAASLPQDELPYRPEVASLREEILARIEGLRIAKVKLYDLGGLVVFSSQPSQIGDNKGDNGGFLAARNGRIANEIVYRNEFSAFEAEIYDRNLVSSYIPVREGFDSPVEGVLEIYSDVTPLMQEIEESSIKILFSVTTLMLLLYLFLLLIVRRAHQLIRQHDAQVQVQQLEQMRHLESHDELTGLYNRSGLLALLHKAGERLVGNGTALGVMAIKLLSFREVNDTLGHSGGDKLLRQAAERIVACAPGNDSVCRIDGDEFVMVLENVLHDDEGGHIANKLFSLFAEPFIIEGHRITLSLAIGMHSTRERPPPVEQLLNNAAIALATAKGEGSERYLRYSDDLVTQRQQRFELALELGRAIERREFVLYYQPKVSTLSGRVLGMEALLRWQHPQRGLVLPDNFIPLLEQGGGIVEVGSWLLREACHQCRRWHDEGEEQWRVAVNVSPKQLYAKNFLDSVAAALEESGLPPHCLELEITESILAEDKARVRALLQALKHLGVVLSIDDFGTGYSALNYLMHFPLDFLKIDRSFIHDITSNRDHAALTNAIVAMAKSLNLGVIAEGVESREQLELVQQMGCDEVQGFYFSKAVAAESFTEVVGGIHCTPHAAKHVTH